MQQKQQRQFDAFRNVQQYLDANKNVVGALANSAGRIQLDTSVTTITTLINEQGVGSLGMTAQIGLQGSLTTDLKMKHMDPIATFARGKLRGAADYAALAGSFAKLQKAPLIHAARAMATAAVPYVSTLVASGFPADIIDQLGTAATALETTIANRTQAKSDRVVATKGIMNELRAGREAVTMLDAVIKRQFAADTAFIAGWKLAKRVSAKLGGVRTAAAPAIVPTQPVAPTGSTVTPSAASVPVVA